ncbi:hypothetical protein AB0284_21760 [Pseudarthrobacter phenanthrenivorans]|uniref:hypothetical protein n=1 Tax=Pseudarthrobacter phenanthrenivorans TaxID=361575 RepID=UPI00344F4197
MLVLAGMCFGVAVAMLLLPALPARPQLRALEAGRPGVVDPVAARGQSLQDRISAWVLRTLPERVTMSLSSVDLDIVGITRVEHTWKKVFATLLMVVSLLAMSVAAQLFFSLPLWIGLVFALGLGAVAWILPDTDVTTRAKAAREEFGRSVAVFVELLAAERRRDAPAAVALENAASVSEAWAFRRIRQELLRARYNKVQPWTALEALSIQLKVPELGDAARIMALSGDKGAAVYEPLRALGKGLRIRMLNEDAAREARASDKMMNLVTGVAVLFVMIILTPMMLTLLG